MTWLLESDGRRSFEKSSDFLFDLAVEIFNEADFCEWTFSVITVHCPKMADSLALTRLRVSKQVVQILFV